MAATTSTSDDQSTNAWKDPELGELFLESLADPLDTGTIKRRFDDLPSGVELACKTGYIRGVSCLSGVVGVGDGRRYAFSILCNEIPSSVGVRGAMAMQERIVDLIIDELMAGQGALGGG